MKKPILHSVVTFCVLLPALVTSGQQPLISSLSSQSAAVGTSVIITGSGFNTVPASNIVRFGAVTANVTSASVHALTVTVPAGASYHAVNVLNTASGLSGYSSLPFATTFTGCSPFNVSSLAPRVDFITDPTAITRSVVFGDLDGDGKADMIATNTGTFNMSIYKNTTTASAVSFASKVDFSSGVPGSAASGVAVGDLNGDGKLDVVVSSYNVANVSVFINTTTTGGTISFAPKVDFPTMTNPLGVAITDIDGDGKPDMAVANYGAAGSPHPDHPSVSLFLNTSTINTTSFITQTLTAGLTSPRELAFGDMDGDGKPDLVVSDELGTKLLAYRNISVSGTISFDSPVTAVTGINPRGVSLGDLDGNGKLDIAVVNTGSGSVSVFKNTSPAAGTISLSAKTDYTCGASPREVSLADIDGDGKPEMAASGLTSGQVSVFRNTSVTGTISFSGKVDFTTVAGALGVGFEDVNNDGKIDLAIASNTGNLGIWANASPLSTLSNLAATNVSTGGVCDNSTWKTLYDAGSNGVIASIKDNGNNLGIITTSVYVESKPGTVSSGQHYLARHFLIKPAVQPTSPVQIRLYFTDAELLALRAVDPAIQSVSSLSVTKYDGPGEDGVYNAGGGTASLIPSTSITTGYAYNAHYLEFTISSFSEFWIQNGLTILPVKLTSFTADKKPTGTLLKWVTASEENSDRFIVERSADGRNYAAIGSVIAAGHSAESRTYFYTDISPLNGNNYYRLQQVDKDGRKNESSILLVNQATSSKTAVTLAYQSPRQIRAVINGKINNGTFVIYDGNGRRIKSYQVNTAGSEGSALNMELSAYAPGIYLYQLVADQGNVSSGKIILK